MPEETQAPWPRRSLADLIDLLALMVLILLFSVALSMGIAVSPLSETDKQALAFWGARLILFAIPWLYFGCLERALGEQTFGKSALGLQAQRMNGQALGFPRSALRAFLKLFLIVTWPLVLAGRPPLYDRLLSTRIVVRPRQGPHRR